ncbi:DUF5324 family protein [Streptomyces sp. LE64]|uniref:DUF5324 family protein n=1 Tax=Streptomyces sp. LE64 TaxID=3448653 RepID=UPI0040429845
MTRIDSVRAATGSAKDSVLHAAEAVAPYADTAKERAVHYAHSARVRVAPKVSSAAQLAADQARVQYVAHLAPRIEQARTHVPPKVDHVAHEATARARVAARQAAEYSRPRLQHAVAAAGPARDEAASRGVAALAALRGQVSADEVHRLIRRSARRSRARRVGKGVLLLGVTAGVAFAVWRWWDSQANPDWLVEPPAATEVPETADVDSPSALDPEVEAKQAQTDAASDSDRE